MTTAPTLPNRFQNLIDQNNTCNTLWFLFFQNLLNRVGGNTGIVQLPTYTVATVPTASSYTRGMIYVSDETGGAVPAFSDGTNWRRVTDRAIVS